MTRVVIRLDPETGMHMEMRSELSEWEQRWPDNYRVADVPDKFVQRYSEYCSEHSFVMKLLAEAFQAAGNI